MEYSVRSTYTKTDSRLRRAADVAVILLLSAALVFLLFLLVLVPCRVEGSGVSELENGEIVLVDRVSRYFSEYSLGDILKANTKDGSAFYRVAATGGDSYEVRFGKAYLNGSLVDESGYGGSWDADASAYVEVPEGSLLLLPDYRAGLENIEGYVFSYSAIVGEARFRIAPLGKFNLFY